MKKSLLHLLALIVLSAISPAPSAHAFTDEILAIETVIENIVGTKVLWSNGHSLCKKNLYGFYHPGKDVIVMCQGNHQYDYRELVGTLHMKAGMLFKKSAITTEQLYLIS